MEFLRSVHEIAYSLRRLRRRPGRAAAAAFTLALGIAAVTAAFSAVNAVLLTPLPVAQQEDVAVFWNRDAARGFPHVPISPTAFDVITETVTTLSGMAAYESAGSRAIAAETPEGPTTANFVRVAGDFFGVLGTRPAIGRLLGAADDEGGAEPFAVVSHGFWSRTLGADPAAVGRMLRMGGRSYMIAGVASRGFDIPARTDAWITLRGAFPEWDREQPVGIELDVIGRLAPGSSRDDAAEQIGMALKRDSRTTGAYEAMTPVAVSLEDHVFGVLRPVLGAILSAALALLVAAGANTALLLLAGATQSAHELTVRRALGATRGRLVRRMVWDAGLVGMFGVFLGIGLAWSAVHGLTPLAPAELPRLDEVHLDGSTMAFAALVTLLVALAAGGAAGWVLSRREMRIGTIRGWASESPGGGLRRGVAGLQIGLAVVTAVGAGLLLRSVHNLRSLDPGYVVNGLTVVSLNHDHAFFDVPDSYVAALDEVSHDLVGTTGIVGATPTVNPPLSANGGIDVALRLENQTIDEVQENPYVSTEMVLPGYFDLLGIPVLRGRALDARDGAGGAPVVVVNQAAARALWPGADALGRRVNLGFPGYEEAWWSVVGVVADTRYRAFLEPRPAAYFPLLQLKVVAPSRLVVRTAPGGPPSVRELVAASFTRIEPAVRVLGEERLTEVLQRPTARHRFAAGVLLCFAGVTLALAMVGVYGAFSVLVDERARELGVRRALGAGPLDLAGFVGARILRVAAVGVAGGLLAALWATGLLEALLFGVPATDFRTYGFVSVGAVLLALVAGFLPALRASRADPLVMMRTD